MLLCLNYPSLFPEMQTFVLITWPSEIKVGRYVRRSFCARGHIVDELPLRERQPIHALGSHFERRDGIARQPPYWSRAKPSRPRSASFSTGARKVTCTTPGWRPISIAPVIVARFLTSGTV